MTDLDELKRAVAETAPVLQPDAVLSGFGQSKEPTAQMILEGRVGKGTYQEIGDEVLSQLEDERERHRQELKLATIEGHEQGLVKALGNAEAVRNGVLEIGMDILDDWRRQKSNKPDELPTLTKNQVDLLSHARLAAERVEDRVAPAGLPSGGGSINQINIGAMFAGVDLPDELQ